MSTHLEKEDERGLEKLLKGLWAAKVGENSGRVR
jgi:hypothetical protein